MWFYV